ncbi:MAG TPA: O-antigen polymerase [Opitutaceae bacterium]|nr:O-antigen polymerase [Opitutaceae bacterium]
MKTDPNAAPAPAFRASVILVAGLAATSVFAHGATPVELAHQHALGVAFSIFASLLADYRGNLRNLVRADLMAITSLYFLTLFEFLLPQPDFNEMVNLPETQLALEACLCGFAGIALGRHLSPQAPDALRKQLGGNIPPRAFLTIFTASLVGGYLHMLLAVNFNLSDLLYYFNAPRFYQPWTRGKFGDWKALLGEFGMVLYLVPPIAGIVFAKRREYSSGQRFYVTAGFLFTVYYGFTTGTRNIFATYLATFLVAYAFAMDQRKKRELVFVAGLVGVLMLGATVLILRFRSIGFSAYLAGRTEVHEEEAKAHFFVDYNLYVIAKLTNVFPDRYPYLGLEIPYLSLVRPIPRAIWSGKPEGLSVSIEDAVGVEGLTLASSFVGEAYMSGGLFGVFLTGLAFGSFNGWWNRLGRMDNSPFGHLVFASGFFSAVISMRSMFVFTTAILPTVAALAIGLWLLGRRQLRRQAEDPSG